MISLHSPPVFPCLLIANAHTSHTPHITCRGGVERLAFSALWEMTPEAEVRGRESVRGRGREEEREGEGGKV